MTHANKLLDALQAGKLGEVLQGTEYALAPDDAGDGILYDPPLTFQYKRLNAARVTALLAVLEEVEKHVGTYFMHYMLDEAADARDCVCGQAQHIRAKAVEDVLATIKKARETMKA